MSVSPAGPRQPARICAPETNQAAIGEASDASLKEDPVQVKCQYYCFPGCELHSLRYAGDECNSEDNIKWLNELDPGKDYVQVAEFLTDFHTAAEDSGALEPDTEYTDYQWWLARTEDGGWQLLSWGN